ncbi:GNAT family N-acetyltransferase [Filimonas effusa]|nr:GNAT family N-acetyltransferase [Filimonas effusa]
MQLQRITAADDSVMDFIQQLYEASFPIEERRLFTAVKELLLNSQMRLVLVTNEARAPVGFVIYWQFDDFVFIEHLAIDAAFRSLGFGKKIIQQLLEGANGCCLLEVEHAHDTDSEKRIRFYQRLGFHFNEEVYFQPAYHEGGQPVPMLLLSNSSLLPEKLAQFIKELKQTVYSIREPL